MLSSRLEGLLKEMEAKNEFSGVMLIKKKGETVFSGSYGYANRGYSIPNRLDTMFPHASVTKLFTSVSILQLVEAGKISLETGVAEFLGFSDSELSKDITVHHLLSHTSGISDYFDEDEIDGYEKVWREVPNYSIKELSSFLPMILGKPAAFKPGCEFSYCSAGYILLGLMVEKASGFSYFNYVRHNIFEKAQMKSSDFIPMDEVRENIAEGYIPVRGQEDKIIGWRRNIYCVPFLGASDGGAYSSAEDLAAFMRSVRNETLISQNMHRLMSTPKVQVTGNFNYGYGTWVLTDNNGQVIRYGHTGEDPGVSARVMYYPTKDIDIIILGNQSDCTGDILKELHKEIL